MQNRKDFMLRHNGGYQEETGGAGQPTVTRTLGGDYATPTNIAGSNARYNALQNYQNVVPPPQVQDYGEGMVNYLNDMEQYQRSRPSNVADMQQMVNMQYDVPNYDQMSLDEKLALLFGGM
jgi:hypothetical protein